MMIIVRPYGPEDAESTGRLIADTYTKFNLTFASSDELPRFLGPFQHSRSADPAHRAAIADAISADIVLVAQDGDEIVGVLRGRTDKLQSLFVRGNHHRQGVGRRLVQTFEAECRQAGSTGIKVMSTLYAVPFYEAMDYKRTTGVRHMRSFDAHGLTYQPMQKTLPLR
jgi:GNAT superfamily N-acetyltransferase